MFRQIAIFAIAILCASPAVAQTDAVFRPTNGLGTVWIFTLIGIVGALFPDIGDNWVEFGDRNLVRLVSLLLVAIGGTLLADYYFELRLVQNVFG